MGELCICDALNSRGGERYDSYPRSDTLQSGIQVSIFQWELLATILRVQTETKFLLNVRYSSLIRKKTLALTVNGGGPLSFG